MKLINCPLPNELSKVLDSPEFDDEAGIVIQSVQFIKNDLHVIFLIRFGDDEEQQSWKVTVINLKEEQIIISWAQDIRIFQEHPLLLDHNDSQTNLYFNGTTSESKELFIDIFKSIMQLSKNESHVLKYIFSPESVSERCGWGYGMFANGPKTILDLYAQCIGKYGMNPYFITTAEPLGEHKQLKLLEIGDSYFIGESFLFERVI